MGGRGQTPPSQGDKLMGRWEQGDAGGLGCAQQFSSTFRSSLFKDSKDPPNPPSSPAGSGGVAKSSLGSSVQSSPMGGMSGGVPGAAMRTAGAGGSRQELGMAGALLGRVGAWIRSINHLGGGGGAEL